MNERILQKVAILAGGIEEDEGILPLVLDILLQKIKNLCNRKDIPPDLELVIVEMLADYYKSTHKEGTDNTQGDIKAVTRGDTRIEYNVADKKTDASNIDDILLKYKKQLIRFKKLGSIRMNDGDADD